MANAIKFEASTKNCYAVEFIEASTSAQLSAYESAYSLVSNTLPRYGIRKDSSANHYIVCTMLDETTFNSSMSSASGGMFKFSSSAFYCWGEAIESNITI